MSARSAHRDLPTPPAAGRRLLRHSTSTEHPTPRVLITVATISLLPCLCPCCSLLSALSLSHSPPVLSFLLPPICPSCARAARPLPRTCPDTLAQRLSNSVPAQVSSMWPPAFKSSARRLTCWSINSRIGPSNSCARRRDRGAGHCWSVTAHATRFQTANTTAKHHRHCPRHPN